MPALPDAQLVHVGFHVRDLDMMIEFYSRVMGLVLTDSGDYYRGGRIAFLSRNEREHHQIVLASGRNVDSSAKVINQISFRVASLDELKLWHEWLVAQNVNELNPRNHGNAWSIYFHDPEDNRIEIYTHSPWYVSQPFGRSLDLTKPADAIVAETEAMIRVDPSWRPIAEWSSDLRGKLGAPARED